MSTIKTTAKKMTDANVTFISLVDHGASRVPFKIIKQEKTDMGKHFAGLDIGKLFSRKAELPICIVGVVVKKGDAFADIAAHVEQSGFSIDAPEEVEGATIFSQEELQDDDTRESVTIRLNEDIAIITKGFHPYNMEIGEGSFAEQCSAQGFYPGVRSVTDILTMNIVTEVEKAENPTDAGKLITKLMDEAKTYITSMVGALPVKAFKLDTHIEKKDKPKKTKKTPAAEEKKPDPAEEEMEEEDGKADAESSEEKAKKKPKKMMKVAITEDDVQTIVHSQIEAFISTLVAKMDTVVAGIESVKTRMTKSEELIAKAQKAIAGTIVNGSEDDDAGAPVRKVATEYVERDIDTGIDRSGRRKLSVA